VGRSGGRIGGRLSRKLVVKIAEGESELGGIGERLAGVLGNDRSFQHRRVACACTTSA
jgi:hypothetical protein